MKKILLLLSLICAGCSHLPIKPEQSLNSSNHRCSIGLSSKYASLLDKEQTEFDKGLLQKNELSGDAFAIYLESLKSFELPKSKKHHIAKVMSKNFIGCIENVS